MDYTELLGITDVSKNTNEGPIKGMTVPGVHDSSSFVSIYLGIPYAKPPVGIDMFKVGQGLFISFSLM